MSEFSCPVIRIPERIGKHPNADTLSILSVDGCPVIFRTGEFNTGDLAVYIPVEAVVPIHLVPFLKTKESQTETRIKAKRLRGIFSMGLLIAPPIALEEGQDAAGLLGITKYVEPIPLHMATENACAPSVTAPHYDIESHRKYHGVYGGDELVVVTEKIHGCNSRFVFTDGELKVGSHSNWKKENDTNLWWRIAKQHGLADKLRAFPDYVIYGETFGQVQDLHYGCKQNELFFAIFDVFDSKAGKWLDWEDVEAIAWSLDIPTVPVLYKGFYLPELILPLCEGKTVWPGADNIREGIVIKPVVNGYDVKLGRKITKLVGEGYLTRKGGTELK